jgi:hypothetical protein
MQTTGLTFYSINIRHVQYIAELKFHFRVTSPKIAATSLMSVDLMGLKPGQVVMWGSFSSRQHAVLLCEIVGSHNGSYICWHLLGYGIGTCYTLVYCSVDVGG